MSAPQNPADDINRIIIGLGGQGSRIVNEVRKAVLAQGELPPGLEFIAVDSDRVALAGLDSVPESQRLHLAAPDDTITQTVVPWLPHEFRPKAGGGCGMQRLTGKAMYLVHRHRILEAVREVARKLRQRTQVSNFMVVIVNAFGGGTGSGMVIDFAIDARADLKEITGQDPLMFGVGILPSRAETIQRANGVALLKELHLLLSNKEPILVGGRDYSNPFELYFLTGREVMGIERDDEITNSITRFTIDLGLIPSSSRDNAASGKGAGWVDLQDIRTLVKGAGHMFSTFGYYRASFPADELLRYFGALDKLAELQKALPSHITGADDQRRLLEDKQIAAEHIGEVLKLAIARATRLRSDGILGANRPELAKLLGEISHGEDLLRKLRHEIAEAEAELAKIRLGREMYDSEVRDVEVLIQALQDLLTRPTQSRTGYQVPLSMEEIQFLAINRHLIENGHFRSVMEALGRLPDYYDKTMEMVGKNKILYMPLINYQMSFHTAAAFPPPVLTALQQHGFVRFDAAGNPVVSDDNLWMVMAMLSSRPENIDANKVSARAFKAMVEGHVARRAEVKIVPSTGKRFEVVVHSWMVGIQVAPIAPGHPPRLRELEWLMPEYEQVAREGGITQHHAFLYGDPIAFARLTSVPIDRASMSATNDLVTAFWTHYEPVDRSAHWAHLPPVLAEAMLSTESVGSTIAKLADSLDDFRSNDATFASIERVSMALSRTTENIEAFGRSFSNDTYPLRERLASTLGQLERAQEGPRDPERLLSMQELVAEALAATGTAAGEIARLRADLPDGVRATLARAASAADKGGDLAGVRAAVRWRHAVAEAEGRAARLYEATTETYAQLQGLHDTLARVEEMLRARARGPGGSFGATPRLLVEMDAGGNGHRAVPSLASYPADVPQEEME